MVTGGSAGLGLAIATALTQAGSDVVLVSRSAERCADAAARLSARTGRTVRGQACDVTSEQAVAGLIDQVLASYGRLDVLVTSAGVQARGTLDQLSVAALPRLQLPHRRHPARRRRLDRPLNRHGLATRATWL